MRNGQSGTVRTKKNPPLYVKLGRFSSQCYIYSSKTTAAVNHASQLLTH